jgi:hypothetical protein
MSLLELVIGQKKGLPKTGGSAFPGDVCVVNFLHFAPPDIKIIKMYSGRNILSSDL